MNCETPLGGPRLSTTDFDLELILVPDAGLHCRLVHRNSTFVLADGPYSYSFGVPEFEVAFASEDRIVLAGRTDNGVAVTHTFTADDSGGLEEQITLRNEGSDLLNLERVRCGFTRSGARSDAPSSVFTAIPFRREPSGSNAQYLDFLLDEVLHQNFGSRLWDSFSYWTKPTEATPEYASEAWAWMTPDAGYLISKYSARGMEWALLDKVTGRSGDLQLRWGGIGTYRDQPERGATLRSGEAHTWGVTRISAVGARLEDAFYAFRSERENRGHGCPDTFDPPVHWNELYDNQLFKQPGMDDPESRAKYYTLDDMRSEAAKGVAYHCEALYLDPGWDTNFASKIWDEARLGSAQEFVRMVQRDYGLKVSLHTPMAGWCNPTTYPESSWRKDRWGRRASWDDTKDHRHLDSPICGASAQFRNETLDRLRRLIQAGVTFFMFDGTAYVDECWDADHGHAVPARREAHAETIIELGRLTHGVSPAVLIEMHDPIVGGYSSHYTPLYYGHGTTAEHDQSGFDSVWAFELMWNPLEDLLTGRAIALYYYNLAYSLPLYIHVDLATDNEQCLVLWWNASTCRHLGIGGTHSDPRVVTAQQEAMRMYRELKPYYTQGAFFGIDEVTHVHAARDRASAVINCFNLDDDPVTRRLTVRPGEVGLDETASFVFQGAVMEWIDGAYTGTVTIPARGHVLLTLADHGRST